MMSLFRYPVNFIFIAVLWLPLPGNCQSTTFVLFRHAETVEVEGNNDDPELSKSGKERAKRLANHFEPASISAIYSTSTQRTTSTVEPIASLKELEIKNYDPFNFEVADQILKNNKGGVVLIAAHSNTAPSFVNYLIGENRYEQLNEDEYDNIFIVTVFSIGSGSVLQLSY